MFTDYPGSCKLRHELFGCCEEILGHRFFVQSYYPQLLCFLEGTFPLERPLLYLCFGWWPTQFPVFGLQSFLGLIVRWLEMVLKLLKSFTSGSCGIEDTQVCRIDQLFDYYTNFINRQSGRPCDLIVLPI